MTRDTLSPEFFDCLPPLCELPSEAEQCDSTLRIDCSVPDMEEIPNHDSTELPSFLGQNYENRDCTRVLRSSVNLRSSFHPLSM